MERKGHPDTPPSLLIVVDEFAALAKEIPEFVDGVVDVALRGRSLGLHLVLATQRPAGVITGQIRANTNLRVALRMAADDESSDVVGSPVAAAIERRLPGRAVARIGPQELVPFQSAYVGGHTMADVQAPMVRVRLFGFDHDTADRRGAAGRRARPTTRATCSGSSPTTAGAFGLSGAPAPRRPWLPSLAASYELGRLPRPQRRPVDRARRPRRAGPPAAGARRLPPRHRRRAADRSAPAAPARRSRCAASRSAPGWPPRPAGSPVEVHAVDFAGRGLDVLDGLPHVGSVIAGDDTERVTRLLRTLRERIDQRAVDFAAVRAASLPEYRRNAPDGAADEPDHRAPRQLPRLPGDARAHRGRPLARPVHPPRRRRSPGRRALRDHRRSSDVGADGARQLAAQAPRAAPVERRRVRQRRRAGRDPVGEEPGRAGDRRRPGGADRRARRIGQRRAPGRRHRRAGGAAAGRRDGGGAGRRRAARRAAPGGARHGVDARSASCSPSATPTWRPRALSLDRGHVLVTGPPRSGKTTALATIAQSAAAARLPVFHVHVRPTPLGHAPFWGKVARGPEDGAQLLERVAEAVPQLGKRVVVVVDDIGELADTEADDGAARAAAVESGAPDHDHRRRRQHRRPPPVLGRHPRDAQGRHRRCSCSPTPTTTATSSASSSPAAPAAPGPKVAATSPSAAPPSWSTSPSPTRGEERHRTHSAASAQPRTRARPRR